MSSFDTILKFEKMLAEYTGAPYAIMTDCCTHAVELCLRYEKTASCKFTAHTYLSVPMTMQKLGIRYAYLDEGWVGEYLIHNTRIWDSARLLTPYMYRRGFFQCLSFGIGKPLSIGRGGAILLDNKDEYQDLLAMRYDGRDLTISPWEQQKVFKVGYHYRPTIEEAGAGLIMLSNYSYAEPKYHQYPDLRNITIMEN